MTHDTHEVIEDPLLSWSLGEKQDGTCAVLLEVNGLGKTLTLVFYNDEYLRGAGNMLKDASDFLYDAQHEGFNSVVDAVNAKSFTSNIPDDISSIIDIDNNEED